MQLGNLKVRELQLGMIQLDGGAMFGIVPKEVWEKKQSADARNRIELALRCLLVEGPGYRCLIDTGMGQKWDARYRARWGLHADQSPDHWMTQNSDLRPSDITHVVLTHLHFDHAGGMTYFDERGQLQKTFPNATIFLQEENLFTADNPNPRERASYLRENWEPYRKSGQLHLLRTKPLGVEEVLPGLRVWRSDGHTRGQQVALIGSGTSDTLLFCADLVATSSHLPLAWTMGYDVEPLLVMREREVVLQEAIRQNWMLCFEHDPKISLGRGARIQRRDGGLDFEFSEDLSEKFRTFG